ncbi:MAG TPA: peptidoglycan editing factor PgeF [Mycobacteriales bacterium]|nr:peptidoglycan editing factor PgeF [Mycobacteriales bacterium]
MRPAPELLVAALPGAVGGFTTRSGGVSAPPWDRLNLARHVGDDRAAVAANRDAVAAARFGGVAIAFPEQVHGRNVAVAARPAGNDEWPDGAGCDAVVTAVDGVPIGVLVADCMPVLFVDAAAGVVGAAHAGRRGLVAGVLPATLEAMTGLGADPARTIAVIGPAICGRCYEVPAEMRDEVGAAVPGTACATAAGTPGLDLPAGALGVLRAAGVTAHSVGICTAEDERFYSFRRDGVTGRFAGMVMLSGDG